MRQRRADGPPQRTPSPARQPAGSRAQVLALAQRQGPAQAASAPSTQPGRDPAAPEGGAGAGGREAACAAALAERVGRPGSQPDQPQPRCRQLDAPQRKHLLGQPLPGAPGWPGVDATRHLPAPHRQRCRGSGPRPLQTLPAGRAAASERGAGEAALLSVPLQARAPVCVRAA